MPQPNESDKTVRVIFLLLLPFFLCLISFYVVAQLPAQDVNGDKTGGLVFLKILITLQLCIYVLTSCYAFQIDWKFCVSIAIGLVLSSISDGLSYYNGRSDDLFAYELLFYGFAHLFYTVPFGFKPTNPAIGVFVALPFVGVLMVLIPRMNSPMEYYLLSYILMTVIMEWRIISTVSEHKGPLQPSIIMMTLGAVCLAISDTVLTYDKFHSTIKFSNVIVPLTYYTGQLGIASSIFHLPHQLRPPNPYLHYSCSEFSDQLCSGCPFP